MTTGHLVTTPLATSDHRRAPSPLERRLLEEVRPHEGVVPSFIVADSGVYELERARIFAKTWQFVAHESEVRGRGDYVTRELGGNPVIVARGDDDKLRVFLNFCRHRGMKVARTDGGTCDAFKCPYHGFQFKNTGALASVPFYTARVDRLKMGLHEARCAVYRGLVFATWNDSGPTLDEWLGDMRFYLDIVLGRAEMEVIGPPHKWLVPTAWKLPAENFVTDAYHTAFTHASIIDAGLIKASADFGKAGYHISVGHGHGLGFGVHGEGEKPFYPDECLPEYERCLTPAQLGLLARLKNCHGTVFPNMSFLIPTGIEVDGRLIWSTTLRLWAPRGATETQVYSFCLVEKSSPDWWKASARRAYIQTFGTSGMFEQDDTEIWEAQTRASASLLPGQQGVTVNYYMGLGKAPLQDFCGPGEVYDGKFNETNGRRFYEQWLALMTEGVS